MSFVKNKINNILKDKLNRRYYIKIEIKKMILKSIIQNKHIKPIKRAAALHQISKITLKSSISRQNNNICLKTGRIKGVYKITNFSRHFIKKLSAEGSFQNFKITNW